MDHSSEWTRWLRRFLQYMSGLEVLVSSLDTGFNYAPTVPFHEPLSKVVTIFKGTFHKIFRCILIDRLVTLAAIS